MEAARRHVRVATAVVLAAALAVTAGCTATRAYDEANRLLADGKTEQGLAQLEKAYAENPRSAPVRAALLRERERQAGAYIAEGDADFKAGRLDPAEKALRKALTVDPNNARAAALLADVQRARTHERLLAEARRMLDAGDTDGADQRARAVIAENPSDANARRLLRTLIESAVAAKPVAQLKAPFRKPITLEFRDAQIKTVFDMLSKSSGINFVFDRDVKTDQKLTVFVRNTTLEDVLKLILTTNGLERKVLNENSVLIYPNTPAKQKDYRELVVRSYYLANADVKQASALVKAMVKTQDVFTDEKLNLLVIKDSPEVVRLTDQLVRTLDLAEPEVMLEVEVLEVARTRLQEIGVRYPGSVNLGAAPVTGSTTAAITQRIDGPMVFTTANPALVFNLRATVNQTNILANPRIRVKNKEKARIHIGDKVPVFTSTATANVGVSTNVSYLDVGLKLDVESQVYLNDEVGIKVGLEVSNIIEEIRVSTGTGGSVAYRLGTRNTNTVLQLRDGETQILAGLISDEDRRSAQRIPGLGDIPVLSRLFGTQTDNRVKSEIVLLITPRIVRNIYRPEGLVAELPVGTDSFPGAAPLRIGRTEAGSVGVGFKPGAAGSPRAAADADPPSARILMNVPTAVGLGKEFAVDLRFEGVSRPPAGELVLAYDASLFEPVGRTPYAPGSVAVAVDGRSGSVSVAFRVIAKAAGPQGEIGVIGTSLVTPGGESMGAEPPPPASVTVN
jgi:general secretion pathway protein D